MHVSNFHLLHICSLLLLLIAVAACEKDEQPNVMNIGETFQKEGELDFLAPDGSVITTINIEIADTPETRHRGLMYRRNIQWDQGMLFIFPQETTGGFWMKNTFIPLDIIFISADSQVVSIAKRTPIMSEETISPEAPKQFVVEVRAGFADRFGITKETRVRWRRQQSNDESFLSGLW